MDDRRFRMFFAMRIIVVFIVDDFQGKLMIDRIVFEGFVLGESILTREFPVRSMEMSTVGHQRRMNRPKRREQGEDKCLHWMHRQTQWSEMFVINSVGCVSQMSIRRRSERKKRFVCTGLPVDCRQSQLFAQRTRDIQRNQPSLIPSTERLIHILFSHKSGRDSSGDISIYFFSLFLFPSLSLSRCRSSTDRSMRPER